MGSRGKRAVGLFDDDRPEFVSATPAIRSAGTFFRRYGGAALRTRVRAAREAMSILRHAPRQGGESRADGVRVLEPPIRRRLDEYTEVVMKSVLDSGSPPGQPSLSFF